MSAFEFFFSFYGLVLGLSVAVIATGLATAIQHRKKIRIGWLTPLLALFVGLDIASFWDSAWVNFRHLPFSYGMLIAGLAIALVYFIAASLVFPHDLDDGQSLDDHFWANKKVVLMLTIMANLIGVAVVAIANMGRDGGMTIIQGYLINLALYALLVAPAAFARRARLFAVLIGLHVVIYLVIAGLSVVFPNSMFANAYAEAPAAEAAR
ncbi:hypothetical protein [Brevundimonas sp.]|uniref:hypothetical protein n=1 Tax=Brevundimonas sp. TaxID=1871086 RepID=UPI002C642AC9|nr:hypothetical protein [Brevundimonas sp.]HWQ85666.1 hypothetical protein [Brevundimonas sp.]